MTPTDPCQSNVVQTGETKRIMPGAIIMTDQGYLYPLPGAQVLPAWKLLSLPQLRIISLEMTMKMMQCTVPATESLGGISMFSLVEKQER